MRSARGTTDRRSSLAHVTNGARLLGLDYIGARHAVLVVEDDMLVRTALADGLRRAGYRVIEAANAAEAVLVLAAREPVDVIFTDWEMPGAMDGLALAEWVHAHRPGTPVLLASGVGKPTNRASATPFAAFVPKPYTAEEAAKQIAAALEQDRD